MTKFHLDEHVSGALAAALRMHGFDVTTAADAGLLEAEDEVHFEHAMREGRIIITHDRDFPTLAARGISQAGIAYCHQEKYSIGQLMMMCLLLDECFGDEGMRNHVEYL